MNLSDMGATPAERELASLQKKLLDWYQQIQRHDRNDGNGPAHRHAVPGVWDRGNGALSGQPCAQCALWAEAKALAQLAATRQEDA